MKIMTVGACIVYEAFLLLTLSQLPGTVTLAFLTLFACVLAFVPIKTVRYIVLTLLFFVWDVLAAKQILWVGEALTGATQDVVIEIIATDGMTTHCDQVTHLQGRRIFPVPGLVLYGEYFPQVVCAGQIWSMKFRVHAAHGQLNDDGFGSQRYVTAQHQPFTGRPLQTNVIEPNCSLRVQYLASLQTTLQPHMWNVVILGSGMGERLSISKEVKNIICDTGMTHLIAISGSYIVFTMSLTAGLIYSRQVFLPGCWIHWQISLIGGICCAASYAWFTGMQSPALRTVVAFAT